MGGGAELPPNPPPPQYTSWNKSTAKRRWHTGSRQTTEVKLRRAGLAHGWVTAREHPVLNAILGALDTWRSRGLRSAECASLTARILHKSLLESVTGVWTWVRKKKKLKIPLSYVLETFWPCKWTNFQKKECFFQPPPTTFGYHGNIQSWCMFFKRHISTGFFCKCSPKLDVFWFLLTAIKRLLEACWIFCTKSFLLHRP